MYHCVVVDDELLARQRITDFIADYPGWRMVGESMAYEESRELIARLQPQLCFMDISIIGGSGIALAQQLSKVVDCHWVFTTAYAEFALQAFELDAADYLLKPFENARLRRVMQKVERHLHDDIPVPSVRRMLAVKSIGSVEFVNVDDIIWIKGAANYAELHCQDKTLLHRETLSSLEQHLDPGRFRRVHRSALINIDKVHALTSEMGRYSLLQMSNGDEVKVSHSHRSSLFETLGVET